MKNINRYRLAYSSGFAVVVFSILIAIMVAGIICGDYLQTEYKSNDAFIGSIEEKIIFIALCVMFAVISLFVWKYILVKINILTKEEARTYPYSTPWKNSGDI